MRKIKIVLLGPMPPPNGGVSTHLSRLLKRSISEEDLQLSVVDLGRMKVHSITSASQNPFSLLRTILSADIIHFHLSRKLKLSLIRIARFFGKKVVYTHHNSRNLNDLLTLRTMGLSDQIILVRPLADTLVKELRKKCHIIPAYLPVTSTAIIPSELKDKIGSKKIVFAHCYQKKDTTLHVDGKDLYGFDIILDAIEILYEGGFHDDFILLLADPADGMKEAYSGRVNDLVAKYNLNIIYWNKELEFASVLKHCAVLIRATRSDGDAVSIREALQEGVPVIASDCVERPEGVACFISGDAKSLSSLLLQRFQNPDRLYFSQTDYAPQIFGIYRSLINSVEK